MVLIVTIPTAPPSWVQGMRPPDDGEAHALEWQEVLFRRLTGRFDGLPSGSTTVAAEETLGFTQRMVYYYIGRCVPEFGSNAVAGSLTTSIAKTTPFDTGALVKGLIAFSPELEARDWARFVDEHSFDGDGYESAMKSWLESAYTDPAHYCAGSAPGAHAVERVSLAECLGDHRVWTWEGRLPAVDYSNPPVQVHKVYFSQGTREVYVDWVSRTTLLMSTERGEHARALYEYSEEVEDAASGMLEHLGKELAR